jgi:hypothetical protein
MKKLLIPLFLLAITSVKTFSQPYKSLFGHTQTSWNVAYFVPSDWTFTDSLVVCNDTVINSYNYKSVKGSSNGFYSFDGYIREDTMTGKAWYLDKSWDNKEYLIMDLSLNVGDTFIIHNRYFPEDSIAIVDSIKYDGGNKILFMTVSFGVVMSYDNILTFIEGIGPNAGIIFQVLYLEAGYYLLCAHKDYVQIYTNTGPIFYGECNVFGGGIEENHTENSKLRIFPNPSNDKVQIEYKGDKPYCLEIFDFTGKLIETNSNIYSLLYEVDLTDYAKGMYFVKTKGNNGKYAVGKLLKL